MVTIRRASIALVDFQYFYGNKDTIYIKELAFMGGASVVPAYFLFRPPFDYRELDKNSQEKNIHCKEKEHGINWNDGILDYCMVGNILSPLNEFDYILVVGKKKKNFLKKYLKTNIIVLNMFTSLQNMSNYFTNCPFHREFHFNCALNNLFKIFIFIEKYNHILEESIRKQIND